MTPPPETALSAERLSVSQVIDRLRSYGCNPQGRPVLKELMLQAADELQVLLSALKAQEWRDISTAPEGQEVWLYWGGRVMRAEFRRADGPFGPFANWVPTDRSPIMAGCKPTHWQRYSAPSPPAKAEEPPPSPKTGEG